MVNFKIFLWPSKSSTHTCKVKKLHYTLIISHYCISTLNLTLVTGKYVGCNFLMSINCILYANLANRMSFLMYYLVGLIINILEGQHLNRYKPLVELGIGQNYADLALKSGLVPQDILLARFWFQQITRHLFFPTLSVRNWFLKIPTLVKFKHRNRLWNVCGFKWLSEPSIHANPIAQL